MATVSQEVTIELDEEQIAILRTRRHPDMGFTLDDPMVISSWVQELVDNEINWFQRHNEEDPGMIDQEIPQSPASREES